MKKTTVILLVLLLTSCASSGTKGDEWLIRAHNLVKDATKAHTRVLKIAGTAYKAEGARCTSAATMHVEGASTSILDTHALYECMKPANELRTKIENTATIYRDNAEIILTANSWTDVLLKLPALRDAGQKLAELIRGFSNSAADNSRDILMAPINEAEEN